MAKENVTFKCGCVKCVQLAFGNHIRCKDQAIYKAYLETQICDDCKKAQREADQEREELKRQIQLYREALRYYRVQLNEARDATDILSYAIDMFTDRHPEYAEEIKTLIDYRENHLEDDEE